MLQFKYLEETTTAARTMRTTDDIFETTLDHTAIPIVQGNHDSHENNEMIFSKPPLINPLAPVFQRFDVLRGRAACKTPLYKQTVPAFSNCPFFSRHSRGKLLFSCALRPPLQMEQKEKKGGAVCTEWSKPGFLNRGFGCISLAFPRKTGNRQILLNSLESGPPKFAKT